MHPPQEQLFMCEATSALFLRCIGKVYIGDRGALLNSLVWNHLKKRLSARNFLGKKVTHDKSGFFMIFHINLYEFLG